MVRHPYSTKTLDNAQYPLCSHLESFPRYTVREIATVYSCWLYTVSYVLRMKVGDRGKEKKYIHAWLTLTWINNRQIYKENTLLRGQWDNPVKEWILNICLVISIPLNPLNVSLVIHWLRLWAHIAGALGLIPGKGTRSHMKERMKMKSLCCVPFFATLQTVACQVPPSMGFSRQEY